MSQMYVVRMPGSRAWLTEKFGPGIGYRWTTRLDEAEQYECETMARSIAYARGVLRYVVEPMTKDDATP